MYNYMDTVSPITSSLFFVLLVILGAFISLTLVISAIMQSYLNIYKAKQEQKEAFKRE